MNAMELFYGAADPIEVRVSQGRLECTVDATIFETWSSVP